MTPGPLILRLTRASTYRNVRVSTPAFSRSQTRSRRPVPLKGGGVMGFLVPEIGPDSVGFSRRGQAAEAFVEVTDRLGEPFVDRRARRATSGRRPEFLPEIE